MSFIKNKPVKVKYTRLPNNQINTIVKPKNNYHVFWWWKGTNYITDKYIKYNLYFRGEDYGTSTIPNGKCENDVIEEVTKDIEDGMYDY